MTWFLIISLILKLLGDHFVRMISSHGVCKVRGEYFQRVGLWGHFLGSGSDHHIRICSSFFFFFGGNWPQLWNHMSPIFGNFIVYLCDLICQPQSHDFWLNSCMMTMRLHHRDKLLPAMRQEGTDWTNTAVASLLRTGHTCRTKSCCCVWSYGGHLFNKKPGIFFVAQPR